MNALHRWVIKVTGGRPGWTGGRLPMLELTTVDRATGQRRVTMLSSPLQMDDTIVSWSWRSAVAALASRPGT